jgi:hypothetical protein
MKIKKLVKNKIEKVIDIFDLAGTFKIKKRGMPSILKAREYMETHYKRF